MDTAALSASDAAMQEFTAAALTDGPNASGHGGGGGNAGEEQPAATATASPTGSSARSTTSTPPTGSGLTGATDVAAAAPAAVSGEGGESGQAPPPLSMRLSTTQTEREPTAAATATEGGGQPLQTGMEEEAQQTQQTDVSKTEEESVAVTTGGPASLPLPSLQPPPSQLYSTFPPPPGLAPLPFGSIFSVGPPQQQQQQQSQAAPLGLSGSGIPPSSSSSSATTTSGIANPLLTQPQLQYMEVFKQLPTVIWQMQFKAQQSGLNQDEQRQLQAYLHLQAQMMASLSGANAEPDQPPTSRAACFKCGAILQFPLNAAEVTCPACHFNMQPQQKLTAECLCVKCNAKLMYEPGATLIRCPACNQEFHPPLQGPPALASQPQASSNFMFNFQMQQQQQLVAQQRLAGGPAAFGATQPTAAAQAPSKKGSGGKTVKPKRSHQAKEAASPLAGPAAQSLGPAPPPPPKRASSAKQQFIKARRTEAKKERPDLKGADMTRWLGEEWDRLADADRAVWEEQARVDKEQYQQQKAVWQQQKDEFERSMPPLKSETSGAAAAAGAPAAGAASHRPTVPVQSAGVEPSVPPVPLPPPELQDTLGQQAPGAPSASSATGGEGLLFQHYQQQQEQRQQEVGGTGAAPMLARPQQTLSQPAPQPPPPMGMSDAPHLFPSAAPAPSKEEFDAPRPLDHIKFGGKEGNNGKERVGEDEKSAAGSEPHQHTRIV